MRTMLAIAVSATVVLGLAACAPDDRGLPSSTGTPSPAVTEGTLPPEPVNEEVGINCTTLISDQVIYDWGSGNFALDSSFAPEAGSTAALIATDGGLVCRWINLTSQETVDAAVAIPTADELTTATQDAAAAGSAAPELGDAYFRSADGIGHLDVFSGGYWMTLESTWFYAATDASALVDAATTALPPVG